MKIIFDDGGYIEFTKSPAPNKMFITVSAINADNPQDTIINSGEITFEQLKELVESVSN